MGGRELFLFGALAFACGGESHVNDTSDGGRGGDGSTGGTDATGGTNSGGTNSGGTNSGGTNSGGTNSGGTNSGGTNSGGTNSGGTTGGTSGSAATGGAAGTGGSATPGGFSGDAQRVGDAWSNGVVDRCQSCSPEGFDGCVAEDGVLVPSPFLLICLSQLATTDAEVADFLARWAAQAEEYAANWQGPCGAIPPPPPPLELPAQAASCTTRDFGCPEHVTGTLCDGIAQCISAEDERFCGPIAEVFTCHHLETVSWDQVCNGVPECEFGEDERTCPALPIQ